MHHCLCISEVLRIILGFIEGWDEQSRAGPRAGRTTLARLARTCRLLSSPALDVIWRDLYGFAPLLKLLPTAALSLVGHPAWLTFHKYAKRVKIFHTCGPVRAKEELVSFLRHCPKAYLPLLPNVTELEWSNSLFSVEGVSGLTLLEHFVGPAVTTLTLVLKRMSSRPSYELSLFVDLPRLCPNVISFTVVPDIGWDDEATLNLGGIVAQWPTLQTLRSCAIPQPVMDQLFAHPTLETLSIDCRKQSSITHRSVSSPVYHGSIPHTVRDFSLKAETVQLCICFLRSANASPIRFCLVVGLVGRAEDAYIEEMFNLFPSFLDTSRLLSFTIQKRPGILTSRGWYGFKPQEPLVSALVAFTALRELDLDALCTVQLSDADYARMARSLPHLRSLKLGTADQRSERPLASVRALITLLLRCRYLETFHIVFDGSIPPPEPSGELACQGWGASNRLLTELHVGYSPISDETVSAIASCFKLIMPCLARIERTDRDEEWGAVRTILESWD